MEIYEYLLWGALFLLVVSSLFRTKESSSPDVNRLERKVDYLLKHFDLDPKEAAAIQASAEVLSLVQASDKIGAIKQLRKETHMGLREAKEAVEELIDQRRNS
jgi:ribosomal protein L7/L12